MSEKTLTVSKELACGFVSRAEPYMSPERFDMAAFQKYLLENVPEDDNECLVETAGFEPLDVKLYKMYQAGVQAKANVDMLNVNDYRDIYLNPDFSYDEDMEIEEIEEIERMRREYIAQIQAKKQKEDDASINLSDDEKEKFSKFFKAHMDEFRKELNSADEGAKQA